MNLKPPVNKKLNSLLNELHQLGITLTLNNDHDLSVRGKKENLSPQLIEKLTRHKNDILQWLTQQQVPENADLNETIDLSMQQQLLWQHEKILQRVSVNNSYQLHLAIHITGSLNSNKLQQALQQCMDKHSLFKANFIEHAGHIRQIITHHKKIQLQQERSPHQSPKDVLAQQQYWLDASINIEKDDLLQAKLIELSAHEHFLLLKTHHLVTDAWSNQLLLNDLIAIYSGEQKTTGKPLYHYLDYCRWQAKQLKAQADTLSPTPDISQPFNFIQKPAVKNHQHRIKNIHYAVIIDNELRQQIHAFNQSQQLSNFSTYLTAFSLCLSYYGDNKNFTMSYAAANRQSFFFSDTVGLFVAMAPLTFQLNPQHSLLQCCQQSFQQINCSQSLTVQRSFMQRAANNAHLLDIAISYSREQHQDTTPTLNELSFNVIHSHNDDNKFPVFLSIDDHEQLSIHLNVADDLPQALFTSFAEHFITSLKTIIQQPDKKLQHYSPLSRVDVQQLLDLNTDQYTPLNDRHFIHECIARQAEKIPHRTAVIFNDETLSYQQLNQQSNQLAHYLHSHYGSDNIIALSMLRSFELIISLLAILKSGNAYLPIDQHIPDKRKAHMLNDSHCVLLLSDKTENVKHLSYRKDQHHWQNEATSNAQYRSTGSLLNLIYTSGSTGMPKAVMMGEQALMNRLCWMQQRFEINDQDCILQKTSISFDVSVWELFWPLMFGAKLCLLAPDAEKDPKAISQTIHQHGITALHFVPSMLHSQLQFSPERLNSLQRVFTSGEALQKKTAAAFFQHCPTTELHNLYGPTEAAIDVSHFQVTAQTLKKYRSIPIGQAISNIQLSILNSQLQPLPVGAIGELYIAGLGLADGYHNNTALSDERFIDNPWFIDGHPSQKFYKTGDLCRLLEDGNIEYLHRNDHQIKLRGFRIELDEISRIAEQKLSINKAFCLLNRDTTIDELILFYLDDRIIDEIEGRNTLAEYLYTAAVPSRFIKIDKVPTTFQGKLDTQALLETIIPDKKIASLTSNDDIENRIIELWKQYFDRPITGDSDFFYLGGHSLLALQFLQDLAKQRLYCKLEQLYQYSNVAALAKVLTAQQDSPIYSKCPHTKLSITETQQQLLHLQQLAPHNHAYHMPGAFILSGDINIQALQQAFRQLLQQQHILRCAYKKNTQQTHHAYLLKAHHWQLDYQASGTPQMNAFFKRPFDLSCEFPIRVRLIKQHDCDYILAFCLHHIAADAWSLHLIFQQVLANYHALLHRNTMPLITPPIQFYDYAYSLDQNSNTEKQQALAYWQQQLHDAPKLLNLPHHSARPAQMSFEGKRLSHKLSHELSQKIFSFCQSHRTTPFIFTLSLYQLLLSKLASQDDVCIALSNSGRHAPHLQDLIGYFVNTLVIRSRPYKELRFGDYLEQQKMLVAKALTHQQVSFDDLFKHLALPRNAAYIPIAQVGFNYLEHEQLFPLDALGDGIGFTLSPMDITSDSSKQEMTWIVSEANQQLSINIDYKPLLFSTDMLTDWLAYYENLAEQVIANADIAIGQMQCLSTNAIHDIMHRITPDAIDYFPLTAMQKDIYVDSLLRENQTDNDSQKNGNQNRIGFITLSDAQVDLQLWQKSLNLLYQHSDNLRSSIIQANHPLLDFAYQVILPASESDFSDCHQLEERQELTFNDRIKQQLINELLHSPYPDNKPLWRAKTVAFKDDIKLFIFTAHHSIFDGVNTEIMGRLLKDNYQRLCNDEPLQLPDNNYKHCAESIYLDIDTSTSISHWQQQLRSLEPPLNFSSLLSGQTSLKEARFEASPELWATITAFCKNQRTTPAIYFKSLFALTIKHIHCFKNNFILTEVHSGRTAKTREVQGVLFEQHINLIENSNDIETFSQWLKYFAKLRKKIKQQGILSIGRQQSLFAEHGDYLFNFYIMQSETKFLERIEKIEHLIPKMPQRKNLIVSLMDGSLRLQFFYPENKINGEFFLQALCHLQEQLLSGTHTLSKLSLTSNTAYYFDLRDSQRLTLNEAMDIENGSHYYLADPYGKAVSQGIAGQLTLRKNDQALAYVGMIQQQQLTLLSPLPRAATPPMAKAKIPARNTLESQLCDIFQHVLNTDSIGIDDNFFELGGHSLHAMRIAYQIEECYGIQLPLTAVFKTPTIAGISEFILNAPMNHRHLPTITTGIIQADYPLSLAQQRLWLLHKTQDIGTQYTISIPLNITGPLNIDQLRIAYHQLLNRHVSLRLVLKEDGLSIRQHYLPLNHFNLTLEPSSISADEFIKQHRETLFSLNRSQPLIRAGLLPIDNEQFIFCFSVHHIICDAESLTVIAQDLLAFYQHGNKEPEKNSSTTTNTQGANYSDYCLWQEQLLTTKQCQQAIAYWQQYLQHAPTELGLKLDAPREQLIHFSAGQHQIRISHQDSSKINDFCQQHGISPQMFLLLSYQIMLARHTGKRDICVGITRNGRVQPSLERSVGFYINALIIRQRFNYNLSLFELINQFSDDLLHCYQHEFVPIDQVIQSLKLPRTYHMLPIVQAAFNYIETDNQPQKITIANLHFTALESPQPLSKFELMLNCHKEGSVFVLDFDYADELFERETIQHIATDINHVIQLLLSEKTHCSYQLLGLHSNVTPIKNLDTIESIHFWQEALTHCEPFYDKNAFIEEKIHTYSIEVNSSEHKIIQHFIQQRHVSSQLFWQTALAMVLKAVFRSQGNLLLNDDGVSILADVNNQSIVDYFAQQSAWIKIQQSHVLSSEVKDSLFKQYDNAITLRISENGIVIHAPNSLKHLRLAQRILHTALQLTQVKHVTDIDLLLSDENKNLSSETQAQPTVSLLECLCLNEYKDSIAIISGQHSLSYQELELQSNALANHFINLGLRQGDNIVIVLERRVELLVAILAVIKSGGCYIPLDSHHPDERLQYMLQDSNAALVITQNSQLKRMASFDLPTYSIDDHIWRSVSTCRPPMDINGSQDLYRIYTSGSTGLPKAASITHDNESNLLHWYIDTYRFTPHSKTLIVSASGFDLTQKNFFALLCCGGTVVFDDSEHFDPRHIIHLIRSHSITYINCAPSAFYPIVEILAEDKDFSALQSLTQLFLGGESIQLHRFSAWITSPHFNSAIINMYGPTECTDIATSHCLSAQQCRAALNDDKIIVPLASINNNPTERSNIPSGVQLYVLDEQLRRMPPGFIGELCIAGSSVGSGYWQRPELTQAHFIDNPFSQNSTDKRLYKTGDLVKIIEKDTAQQLIFIGRKDLQVKLRGQRIELGEVEQTLRSIHGIDDATALIDNDKLIAFALTHRPKDWQNLWRDHCRQSLPEYMLPQQVIALEAWPLTVNGKIDRQALLAMAFEQDTENTHVKVEPRNSTEQALADVWREVLGVGNACIHDNFFELGGDSLAAVRLIARIEVRFEIKLPVAALFGAQTIAKLAHAIYQQTHDWSPVVPIQPEGDKTPIFALHALGGMVLSYQPLAQSLGKDQPFYGIQAYGFKEDQAPFTELHEMIEYYTLAIINTQSSGPYQLIGHSLGGLLAIEVARNLQAKGYSVSYVGLIDSHMPIRYMSIPLDDAGMLKTFADHNFGEIDMPLKTLRLMRPEHMITSIVEQLKHTVSEDFIRSAIAIIRGFQRMFNKKSIEPIDVPLYLYRAEHEMTGINKMAQTLINRDPQTLGWHKKSAQFQYRLIDDGHFAILKNAQLHTAIRDDIDSCHN